MLRLLFIVTLVGLFLLGSELIGFATWLDQFDGRSVGLNPASVSAGPATTQGAIDPARTNQSVDQLRARPPFSPLRRPDLALDGQAGPDGEPRLAGVVSWPDGQYAIFQADAASPAVVVTEGATLGGWTVQSIAPDGVTVRHGEERKVLHPAFAAVDASTAKLRPGAAERPRDASGRHIPAPTYLERRS